jgi:paired amphipathic helix protein Sin3a
MQTEAQTPIHSPLNPPFLRRSLKGADSVSADVLARGGLAMKVCVRTYRLFFVPGSEDVLMREPSVEEIIAAQKGAQLATEKRARWMEKVNKGEGLLGMAAETARGEPTVTV